MECGVSGTFCVCCVYVCFIVLLVVWLEQVRELCCDCVKMFAYFVECFEEACLVVEFIGVWLREGVLWMWWIVSAVFVFFGEALFLFMFLGHVAVKKGGDCCMCVVSVID